jgi:hypothetical protein
MRRSKVIRSVSLEGSEMASKPSLVQTLALITENRLHTVPLFELLVDRALTDMKHLVFEK